MSLPSVPSNPDSVNDDIDRVAQLVAQSYKMGPEEQMNNKQIAYDRIEEIAEQISYGGNIDGVRSNLIDYFNDKVQEYENMIQEFSTGGRVGFQKGTSKIFDQLEMDVPHPYGHRVNYQIGGPAYDATNPIYGSSAITVTPDTIMGPQGNQIQAQTGVNPLLQRMQSIKPMDRSYATRAQDIARPYVDMATKAGYGNVPGQIQGIGSDVRHTVGASMGKDSIIDFISQFGVKPEGRFADFIGNAAIFGSTAAQELQDAYGSLKRGEGLAQPFEDVKANFAAMNLPYGSSEQEKLDYAIAQSPSKYMINTTPIEQSNSDLLAGERARLIKEGIDPMSVGLIGGTGDPNQQPTTPMAGYGTTYKWDSNTGKYNLIDSQARKGQGLGFMTAGEYGDPMYGKILGVNPDNTLSILGDFGKANTLSKEDYEYYNPNNIYGDLFNFYNTGPGYASGGRVGFASGGAKKGVESLIEMINKKFGKGTAKKGSELKRPEAAEVKQMIDDFMERNPDPNREMTEDEIYDFAEEIGGELEAYNFDGTVGSANRIRQEHKEYMDYMYDQYKTGKLDPEPGDKSEARMKLLRDRAEEMEATGDRRLMTPDDMDELAELEATYLDNVDEAYGVDTKLRKELNEMKELGASKTAERFELKQKYPGIDDNLITFIVDDPNPQRKAEVLATLDQAFELMRRGKSPDEILSILKNITNRTEQASGGLNYLSGF